MRWQMKRTGSRELFTLAVVASAIGIACGAVALFSVSFALGAFCPGMVMRESESSHCAAQESLRLRDAFSVLFLCRSACCLSRSFGNNFPGGRIAGQGHVGPHPAAL